MSAEHAEQIIDGYMKRLESELSALPADRRRELLEQISDHIGQARAQIPEETDAALLTVLDRIGEPREIAAEAIERLDLSSHRPGPTEILALALVGLGCVVLPLPPVAWLLGLALVWRSKEWTQREKTVGAYGPFVASLALLLLTAVLVTVVRGPSLFMIGFLIGAILMPIGSALFLAVRLGRRLRPLAWAGLAVVALIVCLPAAAAVLPSRAYAFLGADGPPGRPLPTPGQPGCGAVYATIEYAASTPLAMRAPVSVGVCWDGSRVTRRWGPDCFPNSGPALRIQVQSCRAELEPDGSMIISIASSATAITAPAFTESRGQSWHLAPDGHLLRLGL